MINGSYVTIVKKLKNISVYYAIGATTKKIQHIYIFESIIHAVINSLLAILMSDLTSRFIIEVMAQKTYIFYVSINIAVLIVSIIINSVVCWKSIKEFRGSDINYLLRE